MAIEEEQAPYSLGLAHTLGNIAHDQGNLLAAQGYYSRMRWRAASGCQSWKVDDAAKVERMASFYENMLGNGEPVPEALRYAQVKMSRNERWTSPYFWAAFEMQSEWEQ